MLKNKQTFYSLVAAIIFSILSLYLYLTNESTLDSWILISNNAKESSVDIRLSFWLLFLVISLVSWVNVTVAFMKHKKD